MSIIEFLTARLDEDYERAYSGWGRDPEGRWENTDEGNSVMTPRAVVADVEAKRRMMELHDHCDDWAYGDPSTCPELRLLALPYANHPGYREEWRP